MLIAKRAFWMHIETVNGRHFIDISSDDQRPAEWTDDRADSQYLAFEKGDLLDLKLNGKLGIVDAMLVSMYPDALKSEHPIVGFAKKYLRKIKKRI